MEIWKRNLYIMLFVQFTMFIVFTSVFSYMPLYIMSLGITESDSVAWWSGLISSISSLIAAIFSPLWGKLSDRSGYKTNLLRSCVAVVVFNILSGTAGSVQELFVYRILQGCFSGFAAAAVSLIGAGTPAAALGLSLGYLQTAQIMGAVTGPLIGGLLADAFSYRAVFHIASGFGAVATVVAAVLLQEPVVSRSQSASAWWKPLANLTPASRRSIYVMLAVLFCAQLGSRCIEPILAIYVVDLGQSLTTAGTVTGLLFAAGALGQLLAMTVFIPKITAWGHKRILQITLLGTGLLYYPHALVTAVWPLYALRLGTGLFLGAIIPTTNALIGSLVPAERRGSVYGLTTSAIFLGSFSAVMGSGAAAAFWGIKSVFSIVGTIALLTAVLVWITVPTRTDQEVTHDAG